MGNFHWTQINYFYQVQGQLFCAEKKQCMFIVYPFNCMLFFPVERNDNFISNMLEKLNSFYECYFREALLEKRYFKPYETVTVQNEKKDRNKCLYLIDFLC